MTGYFPGKEHFQKTGFLGVSNGHGGNTPGKRSPDSQIPGVWESLSKIKNVSRQSVGYTQIYERHPDSKVMATSGFNNTIMDNQTSIQLPHKGEAIDGKTISIFRNGGEALIDGRDFYYDGFNGRIILVKPIASIDDDIEVRYQYFQGDVMSDVLLLPIGDFTPEQLTSFLPDMGDVFNIDRLLNNNPALSSYTDCKGIVIKSGITEHGIIGDLQLQKKEGAV